MTSGALDTSILKYLCSNPILRPCGRTIRSVWGEGEGGREGGKGQGGKERGIALGNVDRQLPNQSLWHQLQLGMKGRKELSCLMNETA